MGVTKEPKSDVTAYLPTPGPRLSGIGPGGRLSGAPTLAPALCLLLFRCPACCPPGAAPPPMFQERQPLLTCLPPSASPGPLPLLWVHRDRASSSHPRSHQILALRNLANTSSSPASLTSLRWGGRGCARGLLSHLLHTLRGEQGSRVREDGPYRACSQEGKEQGV